MGRMKYTYISDVNADMNDMNDYANANAINDYANGTNANANGANVSGANANESDAATKSSARKFAIWSAAWQPCQPEFWGRRDQESSIGKYTFIQPCIRLRLIN